MQSDRNRIRAKDATYMILFLALPFSWASSIFGSVYRLISILVIATYIIQNKGRIALQTDNKNVLRAYTSYIIFCSLSMIWTANRNAGTNIVLGMLLILILSYIVASYNYSSFQCSIVDYCWIIAGALAAFLYLRGGVTKIGLYGNRTSLMILGTATDPNEFGSLFVITIPLLMSQVVTNKNKILKALFSVLILMELYAVLLTGSRGALFGVLIACVLTLFYAGVFGLKGLLVSIFGILILVFVLYTYFLPNIPSDVLQRMTLQSMISDSGSGRSVIWSSALSQFVQGNPLRWIFGYGIDGLIAHGIRGDGGTMHNQIIQQLVNYGVIGLFLYLRLLWVAFKSICTDNKKYIGPFLGIMFVSLTLTMGPSYKPLWILLMMAFIHPSRLEEK